ncbi:MAG: hypothetical protein ACYTEM_04560 [Planctomycetota bacterium]|jgi:hypothetical protein
MKKPVIDRYERTDEGQVVIDVSIASIEHLYHDFDKTAPYYRKELDQEFADYLTECVREIGKSPFVIRISIEKMPEEALMNRVQKSVNSYFVYLKELENRSMKRMFRRFIILFFVGIIFLVLAILATRRATVHAGVIAEVFAQGLTIAAWVSLWEAIVYIFLEYHPNKENIRLYNRIIGSQILFRSLTQ